jgi:HEAT repeat protein
MTRWIRWIVVTLVLGCVAGVAAYFLMPQFFPPTSRDAAGLVQLTLKENHPEPKPPTLEAEVKQVFDDFQAGKDRPPSDATRKLIGKLVARDRAGTAMVPLLEAWLRAMFDSGRADAPAFREFAEALLALDPTMPGVVVAEYRQARSKHDVDFCAYKLAAFGKASLEPVLAALGQELQEPARAASESWSRLPWVLAQLGPVAVPQLQLRLKPETPAALQRQALRALALLGHEHAAPALPDIVALLKDKDARMRYLAALALGDLIPRTAPPPPALVETLKDADPVVRLAAAHALSRQPQFDAGQLAPILVALLKDNAFTRSAWDIDKNRSGAALGGRTQACPYFQIFWEETTADLLIELGPKGQLAPEVVVDLLKNCDHEGRHLTHLLLVQGDGARAAVPLVAKMLKHPEVRHRHKALLALARLGPGLVGEVLPDIRAVLDDAEPRVRWQAFLTLAQLDVEGTQVRLPAALAPVVASARLRLNEPHLAQGRIKTRCVWQNFDATLQPAWEVPAARRDPQALWSLTDEELAIEEDRCKAVLQELERIAVLNRDAVPFLVAAWCGTADYPRLRASHTPVTLHLLWRLGPDAAPALPDLIHGLSWYDTQPIANVLVKIGEPALTALVQVLEDQAAPDRHVPVLRVLQEFGPAAKPVSAALVKALRMESETARKQAVETIGSLSAGGGDAVVDLKKLLTDKDNELRRHAADALGLLGPVAKDALPELIALFKDDSAQMRLVAVRAVGRVGKDAVEPLTKALTDSDDKMRLGAVLALARMPDQNLSDREPLVSALRTLAGDAQQPAEIRAEAETLVKRLSVKKMP